MSITLEEAIRHYEESEKINKELAENCVSAMARNHNLENAEKCRQMIEWLSELQDRRKLPEIIFCKDCEKHNKRFDEYPADEACPLTVWRVAQAHEFDYQFCSYGKHKERRTDE